MRNFSIEEKLRKDTQKLSKKDPSLLDALIKKMDDIINCENINHYKNLRKPLQHLKRVHVIGPFVLTFKYVEKENKVLFYNLDHHDNIYK